METVVMVVEWVSDKVVGGIRISEPFVKHQNAFLTHLTQYSLPRFNLAVRICVIFRNRKKVTL